jgi:phosphoribosylformylglycinamidine cyclo-ligase
LIGIGSSGLHSNGYSLARKVCFERLKLNPEDPVDELGRTIGEELLEPTKIYSEIIRRLVRDFSIHGIAHITGGGIVENLPRILPSSCMGVIQKGSWEIPPIFTFLREAGKIPKREMMRTFNNGIGIILVVPEKDTEGIVEFLTAMNEKAYVMGSIVERETASNQIAWA